MRSFHGWAHRALVSAAVVACVAYGSTVSAQAFPDGKTINLISWSAAGSPKDVMARQVAKTLKKQHGWNVVVTDMVGGGGAVALQYLLKQPADGLNVIAASGSLEVALETTLKSSFKASDFDFVSQIQTDPLVLAVAADSPFRSMADLVKAGKAKPVTISGFGASSAEHLFASSLAKQGGFSMNWLPYSGGSKAVMAAMGHNADAVLGNLSESIPLAGSGRLRILGAATAESLTDPKAPSFQSLGYHDAVRSLWRGFIVKAKTPEADIAALSKALEHLTDDPDYVAYTKASHIQVAYLGPADFEKNVQKNMAQVALDLK